MIFSKNNTLFDMLSRQSENNLDGINKSDYDILLNIFAEEGKNNFDDLNKSEQKELLAAYVQNPDKCEPSELFIHNNKDFLGNICAEILLGDLPADMILDTISKALRSQIHIHSINEDMDDAFTDYITSCPDYESHNDELRAADNKDRFQSIRNWG